MRRRIVSVGVGLLLAVLLLGGLGLLLRSSPPGYTRIDAVAGEGGRKLLGVVLKDGERMTLSWRNSQFGLDVTEGFFVHGGLLIQDRVTFALPGGPPPPDVFPDDVADLFHTGGPFAARGLSRPFSRIVYRIGEIGDPRLQVRDRTIHLKREVGFGGRVVLTATRPTLPEIVLGR
jgi:hypothetical protein